MPDSATIIRFDPVTDYYIWSPLALTGYEFKPEPNLLIEIKKCRIVSLRRVLYECLPKDLKKNGCLFVLEKEAVLIPALIDAHVHLALNGSGSKIASGLPFEQAAPAESTGKILATTLQSGIAVVRDGGDRLGINLQLKNSPGSLSAGPRIVATGEAVRKRQGYGAFLGKGYQEAREIELLVKKAFRSGADQIKVIASGVVDLNCCGRVCGAIMPMADLSFLVACAREHGLKVMAHSSSAQAVERVVEAGVDSVEHGYFVALETLKKMAAAGTAWVPTLTPLYAQAHRNSTPESSWNVKPANVDIIRDHQHNLAHASRLGVPLGLGTDSGAAGVRHGSSLHEEIMLYSEGGSLSGKEILETVTTVNAGILGLEKEYGVIEKGRRASLIAVRGNPLDNPAALGNLLVHFWAG